MIELVEQVAGEPVAAEDVAASQGSRRWSVDELAWQQLAPELSDDMIALLAAPVVVRAYVVATPDGGPAGDIGEQQRPGHTDRAPDGGRRRNEIRTPAGDGRRNDDRINQISGAARSALDQLPGLNRTAAPTRVGAPRRPGRHRRA